MKNAMAVVERAVPFDLPISLLKAVEVEGEFHIVGYAATTDFDLQGDVITEEALADSAADLLKNSTVLLNHDLKRPIGRVTKVNFDRHGLLIDALISKTEAEIIQKIKEGVLNKFSIRGQVLERERKFMPELDRTVNVIKKMTLVEVSLVSVPANPEARAVGWYVSKALEANDQGGVSMPEDQVVIEEIRPEAGDPPQPAPAAEAPKPEAGSAAPATPPVEVSKSAPAQPETASAILDKIAALGGEAKPLAEKAKALLAVAPAPEPPAAPATQPAATAAAPQAAARTMGREELAKMIAGEVAKQVEAALKAIPMVRKGLIQPEPEAEDVKKQFESLTPERKLKVALALQQG